MTRPAPPSPAPRARPFRRRPPLAAAAAAAGAAALAAAAALALAAACASPQPLPSPPPAASTPPPTPTAAPDASPDVAIASADAVDASAPEAIAEAAPPPACAPKPALRGPAYDETVRFHPCDVGEILCSGDLAWMKLDVHLDSVAGVGWLADPAAFREAITERIVSLYRDASTFRGDVRGKLAVTFRREGHPTIAVRAVNYPAQRAALEGELDDDDVRACALPDAGALVLEVAFRARLSSTGEK